MSTIHAGLRDYLLRQRGITRYVNNRVTPIASPASAEYPRITYQRISSQHEHHTRAAAGLAKASFQISVFDTNDVQCNAVAEAVRNALSGFQSAKWGPVGEFRICGIFLQNQNDTYVPLTSAKEQGAYMVALDVDINYQETVPTFA